MQWGAEIETAFKRVKDFLCTDTVLTHFDQSLPVGISCDVSNVGIGAVLFQRYPDGSKRPIANISKTLTLTQRNYCQIQNKPWLQSSPYQVSSSSFMEDLSFW